MDSVIEAWKDATVAMRDMAVVTRQLAECYSAALHEKRGYVMLSIVYKCPTGTVYNVFHFRLDSAISPYIL